MAWRKRYTLTHQYNEFVTKAEEESFLEGYKNQMIQLDSKKTILVMCHAYNTVDKKALRDSHRVWEDKTNKSLMRETNYELRDFIKEPSLLYIYANL